LIGPGQAGIIGYTQSRIVSLDTSGYGGNLAFYTKPADGNFASTSGGSGSDTSVERMRITNAGYVGIGTASPGANLDVVSTSTGAAYALRSTISSAANTGYAGYFSNTGTGAVNYGIYAGTASTTGYAGYFSGNIQVAGTVYTTLLTLTSDRRLKDNIQEIDPNDALDEMRRLRFSGQWDKLRAGSAQRGMRRGCKEKTA
jgi:hypothetical protein